MLRKGSLSTGTVSVLVQADPSLSKDLAFVQIIHERNTRDSASKEGKLIKVSMAEMPYL